MITWLTAGESHGQQLVGIIDGLPAGIHVTTDDIRHELYRRRQGAGRGARQQFEQDVVHLVAGVRHGVSTGAPIGIIIDNTEWPKWQTVMSPDPVDEADLQVDAGKGDHREIARNRPLTRPRPGHADLAGMLSYDLDDARPVLERASARETAMRVALGAVAKKFLEQAADISIVSHVRAIGQVHLPGDAPLPTPDDQQRLDDSDVRCLDDEVAKRMRQHLEQVKKQGNTLGGVVEALAYHVPVGLGSHAQHHRRLDARLAEEVMSIQAVKAVEIGDGVRVSSRVGSCAHDEIIPGHDHDMFTSWQRASNYAGGIEGGISNGEPVRVSAYMKPISTVPRALRSVDMATGQAAQAIHQRSDVCAAVPLAVIVEAHTALVLADALLEHYGGYSVDQTRQALAHAAHTIGGRL